LLTVGNSCFVRICRHVYHSARAAAGQTRWFEPAWWAGDEARGGALPAAPLDLGAVRAGFERAVTKRLMSDVPWGVLLSGGLDSSLVASIAARHAKRRVEDGEQSARQPFAGHFRTLGLRVGAQPRTGPPTPQIPDRVTVAHSL